MGSASGQGLKMFLERRLSSSNLRVPPRPQGRADYAPLELLSGVALDQLRKSSQSHQRSLPQIISANIENSAGEKLNRESELSPMTVVPCPERDSVRSLHFGSLKHYQDGSDASSIPASDRQKSDFSCQKPPESPLTASKHGASRPVGRQNRESRDIRFKTRGQCSRFCHICSRTTRKVNNVCCANYFRGTCRKVICERCFKDHGWDWVEAERNPMEWVCTHCRNICPPKAQCAIYKRTNERRRETQQRLRHPVAFDQENASKMSSKGDSQQLLRMPNATKGSESSGDLHGIYDGPELANRGSFRMI